MNHTAFTLLLFFFLTTETFSQERKYIVVEPSYSYYDNHEINLSLFYCNHSFDGTIGMPTGYWGPYISGGFGFKNGKEQMVTRIGYAGFIYLIGGRLSIIHYTDFEKNQFCLRPEVGLSLGGYISLTYGYNFNIYKQDIFKKQYHVLTLSLGISEVLFNDKKE